MLKTTTRLALSRAVLLGTALVSPAYAQQAGSIRGVVRDAEFEMPLGAAQVQIAETGAKVATTEEGNFSFGQLPPGKYTLVFIKDGYTRHVKSDVIVNPGAMTEISAALTGEITEMDEFVVRDLRLGSGTEEQLLQLRMEKPALVDSVSSKLMSLAGAGDAAAGLRLVSGATVQDGKYAVVRGLPDRYVVAQMNAVRLPTADADKRAVQLDQFPTSAIESIQVSKTFTPDQQGDASGGAVNIVLKGMPEKPFFSFRTSMGFNSLQPKDSFLKYNGGGVNLWGKDDGSRDIQPEFYDPLTSDGVYGGAAGVSLGDTPLPYNWALSGGGSIRLFDDLRLGALANFSYERNNYYRQGIDDKAWVQAPGEPITPLYRQGSPSQGEFKTSLFDLAQNTTEIKYSGLAVVALENANNKIRFTFMGTSNTQDTVTLMEDTRGKTYFFPGYDPKNSKSPGFFEWEAAPWLRSETLAYTERSTDTFQLSGWHKLEELALARADRPGLLAPEFDWTLALSSANLNEPDKRRFASAWLPGFSDPPFSQPGRYQAAKDAANFTLGNFQRTWKEISEDSEQYIVNGKLPFRQWTGAEGYFKSGVFYDHVTRDYSQQSFSNFNDSMGGWVGEWNDYWSNAFTKTYHKVTAADIDVDYHGVQNIFAWYLMADVPLADWLKIIGGARFETTELSIVNTPEKDVTWVPPGATTSVILNPGDSDVDFDQDDVLPSIAIEVKPVKTVTLRASYSQTVARQTFKELTPIQQQEYLGADIFVGNPYLKMSAIDNYDLRLDYTPFDSTFLSLSYFYKSVTDPIEYVQRNSGFVYTTAINYPKGWLDGVELEARQKLGALLPALEGLTVGANATFIRSQVTLPDDEAGRFDEPAVQAPMKTRDMTGAPKYLYNLYATYDIPKLGTQLGLFYNVRGDTLVAGAGTGAGVLVPSVYEKQYGTLNASVTQKLGGPWWLKVQAKNLLNPEITSVYRNHVDDQEYAKTRYERGIEMWLTIGADF